MQKTLRNTSTSLAFAVAAFAVTITSVQAFGSHEFLTNAGLNDDQVVAVQEARELRRLGELEAARDVLVEAGIDEETITELRKAHKKHKHTHRHWLKDQIDEKLSDDQQAALQIARESNDREAARAILEEAGIERPERHGRGHHRTPNSSDVTE